MKGISLFYTIFLIVYFPCCIAFTVMVNNDWLDEILAVSLVVCAVLNPHLLDKSKHKNYEMQRFALLAGFYLVYSLMIQVTTTRGVWLDILQQLRPYLVFYTTWVMCPQFSKKQRKWVKYVITASFFLFVVLFLVAPQTVNQYYVEGKSGESATFGQIALSCAMIYYLFSKKTKWNRAFTIVILLVGLLGLKSKYLGECIVFIYLLLNVKTKINLKSPKTIFAFSSLVLVVVFFTWTKFDAYFVTGMQEKHNAEMKARPASYKTARQIIFHDYVPFGSGLGSFATAAAAKEYSPLYDKYHLSHIWGLSREFPWFIADAFYPSLAEFGLFGLVFFFLFWKRRLKEIQKIPNLACYRIAWMCFLALAIESTADTSYLSGKGMGYFILLAVCLNAAKYEFEEEYVEPEKYGFLESIGNGLRKNEVRV